MVHVVLEGEFWQDSDGTVWGTGGFGDAFWQRYLAVFERVVVVSRFGRGAPPPHSVATRDPRVGFVGRRSNENFGVARRSNENFGFVGLEFRSRTFGLSRRVDRVFDQVQKRTEELVLVTQHR